MTLASLFVYAVLSSTPSHAFLRPSEIAATQIVSRSDGICAVPLRIPGAKYAKKDGNHEAMLCGLERGTTAGYCPKRRSTNPAIEFFSPPAGMSAKDLEKKECVVRGAEKEAKFKQTITCSYAPGILAYYHVSRAIGNVANVPTAVLRTYDARDHKDMAERALRLLQNRSTSAIYRSWTMLLDVLEQGRSNSQAQRIFTEDLEFTWGALGRNPRGESEYPEFNGVFGRPNRLDDFRRGPIYAALTSPGLRAGRDLTAANAQHLRQLKDAADFILLDTLLSQQDRFGNFHQKPKAYYLATVNGTAKLEKADKLDEVPAEFRAKAVLVKEMILRDNDCGVGMAFTNKAKDARLLDYVAHMDPETYSYFQAFAARIDLPETYAFFVKGLQLRDSDFRRLQRNVKEASALLRARCQSGALALDLSLADFFAGRDPSQACN